MIEMRDAMRAVKSEDPEAIVLLAETSIMAFADVSEPEDVYLPVGSMSKASSVGLGVALFVRAVLAIPLDWLPRLASNYALAWFVGMISVIAPAGMGVRDGTFGLLTSELMPIGTAMTVAVGVRLWLTVTELFWTLSGRWLFRERGFE